MHSFQYNILKKSEYILVLDILASVITVYSVVRWFFSPLQCGGGGFFEQTGCDW
jgi:hypothetical protein